MNKMILFENKEDCCGCGACFNACPKQAISMAEDEYSFLYPEINHEICIGCGLCKEVCGYQTVKEMNSPLSTYVAATRNTDILKSASGGAFACIASGILDQGGIVYGASMETVDGLLTPVHIGIESKDHLTKLQGSKYVQSSIGNIYKKVKQQLITGRMVLFSGTPCQVAGLKSFLRQKDYKNLLLIDIICHGVPTVGFFNAYVSELEKKVKGKIFGFKFRDKSHGWSLVGRADYYTSKRNPNSKLIFARESSYYQLFLKGDIYRENCYQCKYASPNRPGDITLGDFWGIEKEHPDYLAANGGIFDEAKGISCLIVNSDKGREILSQFASGMFLGKSTFEKAAKQNGQLLHPTAESSRRTFLLDLYKNEGYSAVEKWFRKSIGVKLYVVYIIDRLPVSLKKYLRRMMR